MFKTHKLDPFIIALIGFMAYGLQIPWLGFFQDDWNFVFFSSYKGAQGIFEFLILDGRPGASWVYSWGFPLLGYKPAVWQIFTIGLRILTTLVFWMILNKVWENRRQGNLIISILFLIYPFFTLQPLSVAYAPHFAAFLFYMLSIYFMIKASKDPRHYLVFTIPAILATFVHLFTVEYFIGLELLRPIALWFLVQSNPRQVQKEKIVNFVKAWFPYLVAAAFFVAWRSIFLSNLGIRNSPLSTLIGPDSILLDVAENAAADLVLMLVSSWFKLFDPKLFVIGPIRNLYIAIISGGAGIVYYILLKKTSHESGTDPGIKTSLALGGMILASAMVAAYTIGYIIHLKIEPWNSRFALPALPGLAILVYTLIEAIITNPRTRHIFLSVLIGMSIGSQNLNTFNFKSAWEKQERLYQQLMWRAPSLQPGTAIIANEEVVGYMGDYPLSFAINTMYGAKSADKVPYWFFAISKNFGFNIDNMFGSEQLYEKRAHVTFSGDVNDAIFITYEPENGQCLWVLRPEESDYKFLPQNMKTAALNSNNNSILENTDGATLYHQIVDENTNTWCFFYQKAELARQKEDWTTIITLWDEATGKDLRPYNGFELLPFIEAYANLGRWDDAYKLTIRANKITEAMYFILCPTWERLSNETPPSEAKDKFVLDAYKTLQCAVP